MSMRVRSSQVKRSVQFVIFALQFNTFSVATYRLSEVIFKSHDFSFDELCHCWENRKTNWKLIFWADLSGVAKSN